VKAKSCLLAATEDYSEYESVDEEMDTEPEEAVKGGRSKKQESHGSVASVKDQTEKKKTTKLTAGGAKLKKATSGSGKGSIPGFFMSK
jgi:hypothetical protein